MRSYFILLACCVLFGCANSNASLTAVHSSSNADNMSTAQLAAEVTKKINKHYTDAAILVTPYARNMLLTGQVARLEDRYQIEFMFKNYPRVVKVFNYIQVTLPLTKAEVEQDKLIEHAVVNKLATKMQSNKIKSVTSNRNVYVLGQFTLRDESSVRSILAGISNVKDIIVLNNRESQ